MTPLEDIEKLMRLLHSVQRVKRVARLPDETEMNNTAEHTFKLAMLCWYITEKDALKLDMLKVLKYSLAHDIVEAYAGDTFAYDLEAQKTKKDREKKAIERIEKEFPEFSGLTETIHEYESRTTPEARFVYAADKLIDPVEMSMEKTRSIWKEKSISFETLTDHKKDKIALSPAIVLYWDALILKLKNKKDFFFN